MKKYEYKHSAFGRIRQEKAESKNQVSIKKSYKVCPWKTYVM